MNLKYHYMLLLDGQLPELCESWRELRNTIWLSSLTAGSAHNFISERIANWLQLPVIPTKPFNVKVANGNPLKCQGRFESIQVLLQGIPFFLTLYALPLCGLDLVLRVQWLEQLGTVAFDWKKNDWSSDGIIK